MFELSLSDADNNINLDIKGHGKQTIHYHSNLPYELVEATDKAISQGKAKSCNEFVAQALRHELTALETAEIDAALAEMAQDPEYQAEVLKMETEWWCLRFVV